MRHFTTETSKGFWKLNQNTSTSELLWNIVATFSLIFPRFFPSSKCCINYPFMKDSKSELNFKILNLLKAEQMYTVYLYCPFWTCISGSRKRLLCLKFQQYICLAPVWSYKRATIEQLKVLTRKVVVFNFIWPTMLQAVYIMSSHKSYHAHSTTVTALMKITGINFIILNFIVSF